MPEGPVRHESARRVEAALATLGLTDRVRELSDSTRTAADAAEAIGCETRQIVKSLVFRTGRTQRAVLILTSGAHRVDEAWLERYVGEPLERADPEFARAAAGFAIGGVPPIGHPAPLPTFVDLDLLELREVWAAAGTPHAVCRLTAGELLRITRATPIAVTPVRPRVPDGGPWITFDCYGTLVDWRAGLGAAFAREMAPIERSERDRLVDGYMAEEPALETGPYRPYPDLVAAGARRAAQGLGRTLDATAAARMADSIVDWPSFPDSRASLAELRRRGFRIGLLSNITRAVIERTIGRNEFPVDLVVTAEDVRSYKPAPAHWARFLKETGAEPRDCVHVAGAYEYDLPPAAAFGFRTVFVERYPGPPAGEFAQRTFASLQAFVEQTER